MPIPKSRLVKPTGIGLKERSNTTLEELEGKQLQNQSHHSQATHRHTEHRSNHSQSLGKAAPQFNSQTLGSQAEHNQTDHDPAQEGIKSLQESGNKRLNSQVSRNSTASSQAAPNQTVHRHLDRSQHEGATSGTSESSAAQGIEGQAGKPNVGSLTARLVQEAQRQETERIEGERHAAQKVEAGRLEAERAQAEGLEAQRLATLEAQGGAVASEPQQPVDGQVGAADQPAQVQEQVVPLHEPCKELAGMQPRRSKMLDIVIAHYDPLRVQSMMAFWLWFFSLPVVGIISCILHLHRQFSA